VPTKTYTFHHAAQKHEKERHFCGRYGTTLFWFVSSLPVRLKVTSGDWVCRQPRTRFARHEDHHGCLRLNDLTGSINEA
jgi:hypothetical protein